MFMLFVVKLDTTHCKSGDKQGSSQISVVKSLNLLVSLMLNIALTPTVLEFTHSYVCIHIYKHTFSFTYTNATMYIYICIQPLSIELTWVYNPHR